MHLPASAQSYTVTLPAWIEGFLRDEPDSLDSDEAKMALVHRLADRNFREGNGGPFAALVVESATGRIVSVGVNCVLSSGVTSAHAEVVALALAQHRLGAWDLGADGVPEHELIVNWRPCVQCYGAAMWSGITRLVIAGDGPELEQLTTFDEGPMREDWAAQFESRGIEVVQDVLRAEALAVFAEYRRHIALGAATVYNARGTGPAEIS